MQLGQDTIQIQHLLKLNDKTVQFLITGRVIQIQHLLKLNEYTLVPPNSNKEIQIQHLLKLNREIRKICSSITYSNTTLVKVKYKPLGSEPP